MHNGIGSRWGKLRRIPSRPSIDWRIEAEVGHNEDRMAPIDCAGLEI